METNETTVNVPTVEPDGLMLKETTLRHIDTIRKWALFFSILGFIMIGLLGLGFVIVLVGSTALSIYSGMAGGMMVGFAFLYLIFIAIYFFPIYYLFKFSDTIKRALATRNQDDAEVGFGYLMKHFRYVGILTIVILSIYLLIFVAVFVFAAAMGGKGF
ncbi:MAG TPA: hypothetical protein VMV56_10590 [Williamwhitmania sp.]|nr:hypothetical protein [Williamwhitmania sp.]